MTRIPIQLIFHSIYKRKPAFLVINGHFAVKARPLSPAPCASLRFPPSPTVRPVFSPLWSTFLMGICVFHVLNSSKPGWRSRSKPGFVGSPAPWKSLHSEPCERKRKMFWLPPLNPFRLLVFLACGLARLLMTAARPAAVFLIVKSGRSWPISPGGRCLSSSLNTQQVPILKTWEGNDGGLGWEAKVLNFMRPLSPSYCFKMKTKKKK